MSSELVSRSEAWAALERHRDCVCALHMRELFESDPRRFDRFSVEACGLLLDYSKNRITEETLAGLLALAEEVELGRWVERLFQGEHVNTTEDRPALHMALRHRGSAAFPSSSFDVMPPVRAVRERVRAFAGSVRNGDWKGYGGERVRTVINIGIGGSDLGPAMVAHALGPYRHPALELRFVSNLDSSALADALSGADPESTLFIVASKTFGTEETLMNARSARAWVSDHFGTDDAVSRHFVAVSTQTERVVSFGIDPENMFGFWDWVGGRYSVWSAIGLPIVILTGMDCFEDFLAGAADMDEHFRDTEPARNLPVLLGLLAVWYRNFLAAATHTVLPYDYGLRLFPDYLQQLEMESNGKHVTREGVAVDYETCPVVWGGLGNNAQHAFYQMIHQGTSLVSSDFIVPVRSQYPLPGHEDAVLANALAQTEALMRGRTVDEASASLIASGLAGEAVSARAPHQVLAGNQPSNTIVYETLTPRVLGALTALYEHKVFVQSVVWGINPFDQWGVELGKELAKVIHAELDGSGRESEHDASTSGLIAYVRTRRHRG